MKAISKRWVTPISALLLDNIILIIDDFHYLTPENRTTFLRNVKGAVFNGLKVLLLSVTHRDFDALKAESELTGRFVSITVPEWTHDELSQIPKLGFAALSVRVPAQLLQTLAIEAQDSPFLMQKFCWEICFDNDIDHAGTLLTGHAVEPSYDVNEMFKRLAKDAGLPIYQRLVAGPQNRKVAKQIYIYMTFCSLLPRLDPKHPSAMRSFVQVSPRCSPIWSHKNMR